ncbi:hypothetical protein MMC11_001209 [Xylographa trunciseda]|nr:hypothetical protein [Xylographa trunciseda]
MVVILVGPNRKRFSAHKDLLYCLAPYFEKAFNGPFMEATNGTILLEDDDPAAIEFFICWLYRGASALEPVDDDFAPLLRLYVLADMWDLPVLQNSIIDMIFTWFATRDPETSLKIVRAIVEGCWDCIKHSKEPITAIIFVTIELSKIEGIDHADLYHLIEHNDHFARNLALWLVRPQGKYLDCARSMRDHAREKLYV